MSSSLNNAYRGTNTYRYKNIQIGKGRNRYRQTERKAERAAGTRNPGMERKASQSAESQGDRQSQGESQGERQIQRQRNRDRGTHTHTHTHSHKNRLPSALAEGSTTRNATEPLKQCPLGKLLLKEVRRPIKKQMSRSKGSRDSRSGRSSSV